MARPWLTILISLLVISQTTLCEDADDDYDDADRALLIVRKFVKEGTAVQGRNFTITISLYNAGQSSALSVDLEDSKLPPVFKLVAGSTKATFERIPVGSNATHEYTVVATGAEGFVRFDPATVKYQPEMESEDFQVGKSSVADVYVLTPSQQILKHLLTAGAYGTLGLCKTSGDWRNLFAVVFVVVALLGGNWGYKKVTSAKQKWNREKNLKDFGLDSDDDGSKKTNRKAKKAAEEKTE